MKFTKYLLATALVFAFCATASVSHAQGTSVLAESGSSAIWVELGQGASALADTGCYWTQTKNAAITAFDDRPGVAKGEQGNIWVTWGPGTGTCAAPVAPFNVYSGMNLDSVIGDRCFFETSAAGAGCQQLMTIAAGTPGNQGTNPSCPGVSLLGCTFTDTPIPNTVLLTFQQPVPVRMNAAGTDVRPEDAKFASIRMFAACTAQLNRNPYQSTSFKAIGLGFGSGVTGIGVPIQSGTNAGSTFNVYDFNIAGNDPISGVALPGPEANYVVNTVGEQPIMISVGPITGTGISQATDIPFSSLNEFFTGIYGRATDLQGPSVANPVVALIREPLSGTYNTFEFAGPNSNEFKTTQEVNNCNAAGTVKQNPLNSPSANGKVAGARRLRAIGTGQVTAALINPVFCAAGVADCIGYWFWSSGNAQAFTAANQKYLTLDGVDPLFSSYSANPNGPGVIPTQSNGGLAAINFANLQAGDYRIWSAVRVVSTPAAVATVTNLINGMIALPITANDFIHVSQIKTWKSHFEYPGQPTIPLGQNNGQSISGGNDLCNLAAATPESGGDAGGMPIYKVGNNHFCVDYNVPIGINDKNF